MADRVYNYMERMLPDLEVLEQVGYFTTQELKQVRETREKFEYALQRQVGRVEDYLRYIDYEIKLDKLRKIRKQKTQISTDIDVEVIKRADACIPRQVHAIFSRLTHRYKAQVGVWKRWIEHCLKTDSNNLLSKVFIRALKMHPNEPGFWIQAAAWEFENQGNPQSARKLMLQAIRLCSNSKNVWIEYFRMELLYAYKLIRRRKVLGLKIQQEKNENESEQNVVLNGQVAQLAAKHGIEKFNSDVEFLGKMFRVFEPFRTSGILLNSENDEQNGQSLNQNQQMGKNQGQISNQSVGFLEIEQLLQKKLLEFQQEKNFGAWLLRIEIEILRGGGTQKVVEIYKQAVQNLNSSEIVDSYANYLFENFENDNYQKSAENLQQNLQETKEIKQILIDEISELFQYSYDNNLATKQLVGQWPQFLQFIGSSPEAVDETIEKILLIYPDHVYITLLKLQRFQENNFKEFNTQNNSGFQISNQIFQSIKQLQQHFSQNSNNNKQEYLNFVQEMSFFWQQILKLFMGLNSQFQQDIEKMRNKISLEKLTNLQPEKVDSEDDEDEKKDDQNKNLSLNKRINQINKIISQVINFWKCHGFYVENNSVPILIVIFARYFYGEDISLQIGDYISHLSGTNQDFFVFIIKQIQEGKFGKQNLNNKIVEKWFLMGIDRFGEKNVELWLNFAVYRQKQLLGISDIVQDAKRKLHQDLVEEFMSRVQSELNRIQS